MIPAGCTEIHDDRTREVRYVRIQDGVTVGRRPQTADEIKAGMWLDAEGREIFRSALTPADYRQLSVSLKAKGWQPLEPDPVERVTVEAK